MRRPARSELRFVAWFAVCALAFELVFVAFVQGSAWFQVHLALNARASAALLRVLGFDASSHGTQLEQGTNSLSVLSGCDAIEPTALFFIAVLLFPARWPRRLAGILGGAVFLQALNVLRVASLALISPGSRAFELLHLTIWPLGMVLSALLAWVLWARRTDPAAG